METALVAATAAHAAFQLSVTALAYPALAEVPPARWARAHAQHSRRVLPLVGVVYGGVVVSAAVTLAQLGRARRVASSFSRSSTSES